MKSARDAVITSYRKMGIEISGDKNDLGQSSYSTSSAVAKVGDVSYNYYPWGTNNAKPNELLTLLRSNADMGNLTQTVVDFLCGGGVWLFTEDSEGTVKPVTGNKKLRAWMRKKKINAVANAHYTSFTELANSFIWVSRDKASKEVTISRQDPTTVRIIIPKDKGEPDGCLISTKWETNAHKKAAKFSLFDETKERDKWPANAIKHFKPDQPGQFWYGQPVWAALEKVITIANKIPAFHENSLDSEGVVGMVVHVADQYFKELQGSYKKTDGTDFTLAELKEAFYDESDDFLFGEGRNKVLIDVCSYDPAKGVISKYIEFEPIKRNMTGEEYMKLATYAVSTMSNGSGLLSGLSGVSDGKMNSGGGTEIRISAEYQQFYRTFRKRFEFMEFLDELFLDELVEQKIINENDDAFFGHKNILLQTLDVNKAGVKEVSDVSEPQKVSGAD